MASTAANSNEPVTNEQIFRKLLVIESHLRGKGEDLLTASQVRKQYRIHPERLQREIEKGQIQKYGEGPARGGRMGFMVRRADVIAAFNLPSLSDEKAGS